ncbi:hypothetical protein BDR26DRAFT_901735 [Obelidium mucronatum]|nr:hypothetical protein BDR26DRAFT_901735 [Obelidium mucronatum]
MVKGKYGKKNNGNNKLRAFAKSMYGNECIVNDALLKQAALLADEENQQFQDEPTAARNNNEIYLGPFYSNMILAFYQYIPIPISPDNSSWYSWMNSSVLPSRHQLISARIPKGFQQSGGADNQKRWHWFAGNCHGITDHMWDVCWLSHVLRCIL